MDIIIGSARIDEKGNIAGGQAGDQKQSTTPDYTGEVSLQKFYLHPLGWDILRPISLTDAKALAQAMIIACNNKAIGYNQSDRFGVVKLGVATEIYTACDCSSLVRACIKYAMHKDVGNFTTYNEKNILINSGLFNYVGGYTSNTTLYTGDVLVTKKKGHTVIVTQGYNFISPTDEYYPTYTGSSISIVDALKAIGLADTSINYRKKIALANNIIPYSGKAAENLSMLALLKAGKLRKVR